MSSFNKIILMGHLTRDPELSSTPSQTPVVNFGLATNRKWKGSDGAEKEEVCFIDCNAFGKQAETLNKYLTKGSSIFIEGRLTFSTWEAQDGTKRSKHRVTVENFQFLRSADGAGTATRPPAPTGSVAPLAPGGALAAAMKPPLKDDSPELEIPF